MDCSRRCAAAGGQFGDRAGGDREISDEAVVVGSLSFGVEGLDGEPVDQDGIVGGTQRRGVQPAVDRGGAFAAFADGLSMFLQFVAMEVLSDDRLIGKQIVAEIDRPKVCDRGAMSGQPPFSALRWQSCFSAPSCGAMNSGGSGRTCLWPCATMLAARKAWKYSMPPSARRRVEHCPHLILREQKCSVPSSAIGTRPSRHRNGVNDPAAAIAFMNSPSNAAGVAPSV